MKKFLATGLLAAATLIATATAVPASASPTLVLSPLTVNLDVPIVYDYDGGDGSFNDPWQIGFSGASAVFEIQFSGDTVSNCQSVSNYPDFSVDPFTPGDTKCSFQMTSSATEEFGVRITYQNAGAISTLYFIKTGSLSGGTPPGPNSTSIEPAPAKYSGPEFSGLSAKGIMVGSSPRLEGKNLDEISSIEIGGKAATFTLAGDKALDLTLPSGLAPGLYDLVINSSAGKLTHINAIQVREPRRAFSVTTRSEGRISEDQYREHTIISAMQIPELNKARCIVNGSNLALAKAQAERLCALVAAANPNIETTVIEPRSTVKNDSVFARVTYGWN